MSEQHECSFTARGVGAPDPIDLVLDSAGLQGVLHCESRLASPWAFSIEPRTEVAFHYLMAGHAELVLASGCWRVAPGSLLILPHGAGHTLRDSASSRPVPLDACRWVRDERSRLIMEQGGEGASARLLCGAWRYEGDSIHPLLEQLPELILLDPPVIAARPELRLTLELLLHEQRTQDVGAASVAARVLDLLFVQALRGWLDGHEVQPGWVGALRDPLVGRALRLLHREPSRPWSLVELARSVDSSRSVLARRFQQSVGEAPMSYLTRVRMQRAAELLGRGASSVAEVADQVGYSSEFAFNRAFKRWTGEAPGRFRAQATRPPLPQPSTPE